MKDLFPAEFLQRLEKLAVRARRPAGGISYGRGRGTTSGSGIEFVDLREYSPGDDLKRVDWNLYARLDRLLLRVFHEEREHDVHLLLDVSASMARPDGEKWQRAARIAAALGYVALSRMDRVAVWPVVGGPLAGGRALAPPFPLAGGKRRAPQLFRWLAELEPEGITNLEAAAAAFVRAAPSRGVAVLISDLYHLEGSRLALSTLLRAGFEVSAIQVLGADDDAPTGRGRLSLVDSESGRVVRARVGEATRRAYRELLEEERRSWASLLASSGGAFAVASPGRSLEDLVLRDLRRAGVVQ